MTEPTLKDFWADDGATFIHYGQGYRTGKGGGVVCIGKYPADNVTEAPLPVSKVENLAVTAPQPIETITAPLVTDIRQGLINKHIREIEEA